MQKESEVLVKPVKKTDKTKEKEFLPGDQEEEITLILANMILEERSNYV